MENYYSNLDKIAFWRSGVSEVSPLNMAGIYQKRWNIKKGFQIGTAGSCFAQHIARHMNKNGYNVFDAEPAPQALPQSKHQSFGYGLYSGRYGNIYTVRQLRHLLEEAFSETPPDPLVWKKGSRYFDALRPAIEPDGFATKKEMLEARAYHLERVRELFLTIDLFVFTFGLTEAWIHTESGRVVPIAPGVVAGADKGEEYRFKNFTYNEVINDFHAVMKLLAAQRDKRLRYLLTVSPVPLTATASGKHVLTASTYSKSVLRAAVQYLYETNRNIDYFPSYEIITNPASRGVFFASNLRSVTDEGVEVVMKTFFSRHPPQVAQGGQADRTRQAAMSEDVQCEEAMLEAFGK